MTDKRVPREPTPEMAAAATIMAATIAAEMQSNGGGLLPNKGLLEHAQAAVVAARMLLEEADRRAPAPDADAARIAELERRIERARADVGTLLAKIEADGGVTIEAGSGRAVLLGRIAAILRGDPDA